MSASIDPQGPETIPRHAEIVIVGAGVVGLSIACELLTRGRRVVVLERSRAGSGASGVAAGMLAPSSEAEHEEEELIAFFLDSLRRFPAFVAGLERLARQSCHYSGAGTIWVALNRDQDEELDRVEASMRARSLTAERLTPEKVLELEPHLSGRVVSGLLAPEDVQVDPRALVDCLATAVSLRNGSVLTGCTVESLNAEGARLRSVSGTAGGGRFEIACEAAVLAAGAWSTTGITVPVPGLSVRPVKGQIVRLCGARLLTRVVRSPEVYLVPRSDGQLLVGASMEEQGFNAGATCGVVLKLLEEAWRVLPGIDDLEITELSVSFRPAVADNLPVIGASDVEGLYVATGHFRNGVLLAPATAYYLAELITTGRAPAALARFVPQRLRAASGPSDEVS